MKWIDPSRPKRKIIRCEFCHTDIPTNCRNNGRMNADIAYPHLAKMHEQPKENIKWFVEHPETRLWWSGYKWTNDPLEAFGCDLKGTADRYARFQGIKEYIITEHEFFCSP